MGKKSRVVIKGYTQEQFNYVYYPLTEIISIPHIMIHSQDNKGWDSATKITIIIESKEKEVKRASIK